MRALPWRDTNDPYRIWLSEVILQQTRIDQGLSYYKAFVRRFPDVFALAAASPDEVFKLWQGLGYYNRAANLMSAARTITTKYRGQFPREKAELMKIPGIGPYTAAAVASMAFGRKEPVVDGNVYRVLSRIWGITTPIDTGKARQEFTGLAGELMAGHDPGEFNQALMEFGALHCKPKNPACGHCIFAGECIARNQGRITELPVKKEKTPVRHRYFHYLVIQEQHNNSSRFLLHKRSGKDIWKNLYEFILIERPEKQEVGQLLDEPEIRKILKGVRPEVVNISSEYQHQLTHQKIHARFFRLIVDKKIHPPMHKSLFLIDQNEIANFPVPRLIDRYLKEQAII